MIDPDKGVVRIIGGQWRSRKITFPTGPGVRPTQDRIRETVFNWLMFDIEGAVCLDMFAGSGALGFEALSRGAQAVTFVDNSKTICAALQQNATLLKAENYDIVLGQCPDRVPMLTRAPYDIAFLDAPFHKDLINPAVQWLEQNCYLKPGALIYFEVEKGAPIFVEPNGWRQLKHKSTPTLDYFLYQAK